MGGAERSLLALCVALHERGDVVQLVMPADGPLAQHAEDLGIAVRCIWYRRWVAYDVSLARRVGRFAQTIAGGMALAWALRGQRTVIVSNSGAVGAGAVAAWLTHQDHVWLVREFLNADNGCYSVLGERRLARFIARMSGAVAANSGAIQEWLAAHGCEARVIPNIIPTPEVNPIPTVKDAPLRIGMLGSLSPHKGHEDALRALETVRHRGIDAELTIAGSGPPGRRRELEALATQLGVSDSVSFIGETASPSALVERVDVGLVCSVREALGRVTVEFLKAGRPIIGTNAGETPRLIEEGRTGYVYSPGDTDALADIITALAHDRPGLVAAGAAAHDSMRARFTREDAVGSFDGLLAHLDHASRLRVLMHPVHCDNPYTELVAGSLPPDIEVTHFTWQRAFRSDYDVLHVHWPESLLAGRHRRVRAFLVAVLLARLRLTHRPLVLTVHNEEPHDAQRVLDRLAYVLILRAPSARILLTAGHRTETQPGTPEFVIPHGDYRPIIDAHLGQRSNLERAKRVLHFGQLRPYKGVDTLVRAFDETKGSGDWTLTIAGEPVDAAYADVLEELAAGHSRIELRKGRLAEQELAQLVCGSSCVVLPYSRVTNSGAALYALSCATPVLAPDVPALRELRDEVGGAWLTLYAGELTAAVLDEYLDRVQEDASLAPAPDLSRRTWKVIGETHAIAYRAAVRHAAGGRRRSARAPDPPTAPTGGSASQPSTDS